MKCLNCIDTVYMEDMGDGDWKCPVCGDEWNQYTDYDLYADPEPYNPGVKDYQSGFYTSRNGTPFHVHGKNMSQETIDAIGAMADAAKVAAERQCPNCGGHWPQPLHWDQALDWWCDCGWKGTFEDGEKP